MCMIEAVDRCVNVIQENTRKAKKEHKCGECRRIISPGEKYFYEYFIDNESQPGQHKTCSHCKVARDLIHDKCHGFVYSEIRTDLWEHCWHLEWSGRARRLYIGMKRQWQKFRSEGLMAVPNG